MASSHERFGDLPAAQLGAPLATASGTASGGGADPRPFVAATIGPIVEARADAGPNGAREALAALARIGCPCVQWSVTTPGLRPRELDGTARRGILTELKRLELRCSGVDAWIPPGHLLDRSTIDRAIGAIEQAILLASDLAGTSDRMRPVVAVLVPTEREAGEGTAASELNQAIGALAARAERAGVVLADHALPPRPQLPVGIDPAAALAAGLDPVAQVIAAGPRLASARLVDCFRSGLRGPVLEPGESRLDVSAYRVAMSVVGFDGPLIVDSRQWRDPLGGVRVTIDRLTGGTLRRPGERSAGGTGSGIDRGAGKP
jgi:sugar phosphate isomerase/epimerase